MKSTKLYIFDLDDTLYDTSFRLDEVTPNFETMKLFPDALEILKKKEPEKILVTHGERKRQEKKIKTLGIRGYFKEIYICADGTEKLELFKKIVKEYGVENPKNCVIIGDRVDTEIRFGNMLGCVTVYLPRGKYSKLSPVDAIEIPTYTIHSFAELESAIGRG
ncbi:MAG: HAD family hydrolase [Candidatus Taylorbacteria bacterium]